MKARQTMTARMSLRAVVIVIEILMGLWAVSGMQPDHIAGGNQLGPPRVLAVWLKCGWVFSLAIRRQIT